MTFRLIDSLPAEALAELRAARAQLAEALRLLEARDQTLSKGNSFLERAMLRRVFNEEADRLLDRGSGECWLRDERVAELVFNAMRFFDCDRYDLYAWVVMPNHAHAVLKPLGLLQLPDILHSWKSFTSNKANEILLRQGTFWEGEYYDHLIRDEEDFAHAVRYVLENPARAGLKNWKWVGCRED